MGNLKKYLLINSLFSAFSGLVMLFFATPLNEFFNIQIPYILPIIGSNLLVFSLFVGYVAQKQLHNKTLVNIISGLDGLWVLGSIAIVLLQVFNLSKNGYIVIALVALWIAFLGYKQHQFNQK